jgi:hypothetical protein
MGDHAPGGRGLSKPVPIADLFPPRDIEPDLIEAGRLLFAQDCRFIAGAARWRAPRTRRAERDRSISLRLAIG